MDFLHNENKKFNNTSSTDTRSEKTDDSEQVDLSKQDKKRVDLKRYRELDNVTLKKLNWGLLYIEQRKNLITIRNAFLIFVSIMIWGVYIYIFGEYSAVGASKDSTFMRDVNTPNLVDHSYFLQKSCRDLKAYPVQILHADGRYDFISKIQNPNTEHWMIFEYAFMNGSREVERRNGFILPGETKYLISLTNEFSESLGKVRVLIENIKYGRVNPHKYGNWEKYYNTRMDIAIENKEFVKSKTTKKANQILLNDLKFDAVNNSAYNYRVMDFAILLYGSSNKIVSINKYNIDNFLAGRTRGVDITWPGSFGNISDIVIIPEQDITNENVFLDFEGESDSILR